ncbi:MAG TPA: TetR/AcrR family transcriptional regulator [Candidatus Binatia bacterium]|nr:TetR/AcrR family transcriptional regulator [Candidatus Binatia bacterium]
MSTHVAGGTRKTSRNRSPRSTGGAPPEAASDGGAFAAAREEAKRETREALLRAAFAEFVEHGFDVPSLDAICARAGYTRGAFYVHFRDRDELIVAVMQSVLGTFLDAVIGAGEGGDDLEQTVLRFAGAIVGGNPLTGASGSMRTHHLLDVCARSPEIRARFLDMLIEAQRRLAEAATAGQQAGTVRSDVSAIAIASVLIALAMGVIQLFELGLPMPVVEVQAAVLRVLAARPD